MITKGRRTLGILVLSSPFIAMVIVGGLEAFLGLLLGLLFVFIIWIGVVLLYP